MSSATNNAKPNQLVADANFLAGLQKNQSTLTPVVLSGQTITVASAVSTMQSRVDAGNAYVVARGGYLQAAQANRTVVAQTKEVVDGLRDAIRLAFKNDPAKLADFGMTPPKKPAPRTVKEKVVAMAKNASTRAERHTMGKRAKEQVKGAVPATITVDVPGATPDAPADPLSVSATAAPHPQGK